MNNLRITLGIDNGQSGSIGFIAPGRVGYCSVPTVDYLHYSKKGSIGKRLDRASLESLLLTAIDWRGPTWVGLDNIRLYIERPFSGRFVNAVVPAHRFFEATIITLEDMFENRGLGYEVVDSKTWQKSLLGGITGSAELKKASKLKAIQLYPQLKDAITQHGDGDGLLIAHHYHTLQVGAVKPIAA